MDLLGMNLREMRAKVKFTVLTREEDQVWSNAEAERLVQNLGIMVIVHRHPRLPHVLIISEEYDESAVRGVLEGSASFNHKVVQGFENPELPFVPTL